MPKLESHPITLRKVVLLDKAMEGSLLVSAGVLGGYLHLHDDLVELIYKVLGVIGERGSGEVFLPISIA